MHVIMKVRAIGQHGLFWCDISIGMRCCSGKSNGVQVAGLIGTLFIVML